MLRDIILEFEPDPADPTYFKVWIFAEDAFRKCRDGGEAFVSLEEVDRVRTRLTIRVFSKRRVRRMKHQVEELLGEHFLKGRTKISVETPSDD